MKPKKKSVIGDPRRNKKTIPKKKTKVARKKKNAEGPPRRGDSSRSLGKGRALTRR